MFKRDIKQTIINNFFKEQVIILLGARQVGKTTLVENILEENFSDKKNIKFNCDIEEDKNILNENNFEKIRNIIGDNEIIFIDEAQKVENIGNTLKVLVDFYKNKKQIIVTGSSSFHLLDKTSEPLTGRKLTYKIFPISINEIRSIKNNLEIYKNLENFLIFGAYPKILNTEGYEEKIKQLTELVSSNLYKDILEFQNIKNSNVLTKLLKLLSLQISKEISLNEIGQNIGMDSRTVEKYIDLLEKSYIIFRLPPLFTNKRKELSKMNKIYFYDLGIRNTLINNFNFLENRNDIGELFENFIIVEKMKHREYNEIFAYQYFWQDYNKSEIDLIEECSGKYNAFEIKFKKDKALMPKNFKEIYKNSEFKIINKDNYLDFI